MSRTTEYEQHLKGDERREDGKLQTFLSLPSLCCSESEAKANPAVFCRVACSCAMKDASETGSGSAWSPSFSVTPQLLSAVQQQLFLAEKCPSFPAPEKIPAQDYLNSNPCSHRNPLCIYFHIFLLLKAVAKHWLTHRKVQICQHPSGKTIPIRKTSFMRAALSFCLPFLNLNLLFFSL